MSSKANPLHRPGRKNIHCPFYAACLDYAADRFWECWDCSECPHRATYNNEPDMEFTVDESMLFHSVPTGVYKAILSLD